MGIAVQDRHLNTKTMIWDAASMFLASPTARGQAMRPGYVNLARRVARALRKEVGEGDVTYGKNNKAYVRSGSNPFRITIKYRLSNSLAGTSIMLVHEARHLVAHAHTVDEELDARRLEIMYFQNLLHGRWRFQTRSGQRDWSTRLRRHDPVDTSLQLTDMERFDARHQLVDYVLRMKTYAKSIDAGWVRRNWTHWGGMTNRWPETRGLYVALLANGGGRENARAAKRIVQTLLDLDEFRPPPEYRTPYKLSSNPLNGFAMFAAGGLGKSTENGWKIVRKALAPLLHDSKERSDLERLESRLSRPGDQIRLVGAPRPPEL